MTNNEYAQDAVRNPASVLQGIRNFHSWVGNAVPGAQDIDFCVERHGNFFVAEGKPRMGEKIELPMGQHITLRAMAALPAFTVYLIGEPSGRTKKFAVADVSDLARGDYKNGNKLGWYVDRHPFRLMDVSELQQLLRAWWDEHS